MRKERSHNCNKLKKLNYYYTLFDAQMQEEKK